MTEIKLDIPGLTDLSEAIAAIADAVSKRDEAKALEFLGEVEAEVELVSEKRWGKAHVA